MNSSICITRTLLNNNFKTTFNLTRMCSAGSKGSAPKGSKVSTPTTQSKATNVSTTKESKPKISSSSIPPTPIYVSAATPVPPNQPVGPGATKAGEYKNTEYFCYNDKSFYDFEVEMAKDRLPQPKSGNELF